MYVASVKPLRQRGPDDADHRTAQQTADMRRDDAPGPGACRKRFGGGPDPRHDGVWSRNAAAVALVQRLTADARRPKRRAGPEDRGAVPIIYRPAARPRRA